MVVGSWVWIVGVLCVVDNSIVDWYLDMNHKLVIGFFFIKAFSPHR